MSNPNPTLQSTSAPSLWYVRSDTDATHFYAVRTDARGLLHCECKSAQYRRTPCKHVRQVVAGSARPATVKTLSPRNSFSDADLYSDAGASASAAVANWRRAS